MLDFNNLSNDDIITYSEPNLFGNFETLENSYSLEPINQEEKEAPQNFNFILDENFIVLFEKEKNCDKSDSDFKKCPIEIKKEKIFKIEKCKIKTNGENNDVIIMLGNKRGRKQKEDDTERNHDKYSEDNIIRKIKINIFNYARDIINQNFVGKLKLLKLDHDSIKDLKKSENIKLFNKEVLLKDIFSKYQISNKYKKEKYKNYNKNIIEQIDKGKIKEKKVKKILDLKFEELLEIFRGKINEDQSNFNGIKDELEKENVNIFIDRFEGYERFINNLKEDELVDQIYMSKIEDLTKGFKKWFEKKEGRDSLKY